MQNTSKITNNVSVDIIFTSKSEIEVWFDHKDIDQVAIIDRSQLTDFYKHNINAKNIYRAVERYLIANINHLPVS